MKIFVLTCFMFAATLAATIPAGQVRSRRDVSELPTEYLPAQTNELDEGLENVETTEAPATTDSSAVLGDQGYEYRTVRRLKYRYRTVRDVSHLPQAYLPPSNEYLPPASVEEAVPKLANEYLPPAEEVATETVAETEAPAVRAADDDSEVIVNPEEVPQDSAILADDGYHYKQPEEAAMLKIAAAEPEYLPPVDESIVESVGPEESAVLADDGYHYRAVKRFRF